MRQDIWGLRRTSSDPWHTRSWRTPTARCSPSVPDESLRSRTLGERFASGMRRGQLTHGVVAEVSALSTMHSPSKTSRSAGIPARAFAVWLVLMGVETIHGILRTIFLAPYLGDFRARQVSVFSGSLLIMCTTCLLIRWIPTVKTELLLTVGFFGSHLRYFLKGVLDASSSVALGRR